MPFPRPKKVYLEAELYEYAVGALAAACVLSRN
jgi:hypothetical protein